MSAPSNLQPLFDWLVDGAPGASDTASVLLRVGTEAVAAGLPLARVAAFVRTLHPSVMGDGYVWRRDAAAVEAREAPYTIVGSDEYQKSPVHRVFLTGVELRCRLDRDHPPELAVLDQLRKDGLTDYLILPLRFTDGHAHAIAYATDRTGGFDDDHLEALRQLSRPFARVVEILALRRIAASLLSAYVGRDAGERILRGQIQRGDTESIRCVIWFSDLRGFTALSSQCEPTELIRVLNQVFECQVPAVEGHGGDVLKFMGDGMLAIFPVAAADSAAASCAAALAAFADVSAALDALNATRAAGGERRLEVGVSLHLGDVAYGNIGGATRLDFTCIGPAVNLAARIEGLTGKLSRRLLLSEAFASAASAGTRLVGRFELKGVDGAAEVHELEG
jgi:adenylate cyclase